MSGFEPGTLFFANIGAVLWDTDPILATVGTNKRGYVTLNGAVLIVGMVDRDCGYVFVLAAGCFGWLNKWVLS